LTKLSSLKRCYRRLKRFCRALAGRDLRVPIQTRCSKILLGNERAQWCICPIDLFAHSVVYSFGVGEDISFDLDLIGRFGVRVHAFDPTPRAIAWLKSHSLPKEFVFHEYGIADYDGRATFTPPENSSYASYTMISKPGKACTLVEAPVHRLATIMRMLGHNRIDVLKMDIEGAEYGVVEDLIACDISIGQLLIEFHHRWPEVGVDKTKEAINALNHAGYKIFEVSASGEEYSFRKPVECQSGKVPEREGSDGAQNDADGSR
jgi:FkbM family methyltransferase